MGWVIASGLVWAGVMGATLTFAYRAHNNPPRARSRLTQTRAFHCHGA